MRTLFFLLVVGCSTRDGVTTDGGAATDAKKGDGADMVLATDGSADGDVIDTGVSGCEPLPASDAGAEASVRTQPCGPKLFCDPSVEYCEIFYSGVPMDPPVPPSYACRPAPVRCASNVKCACLSLCLPGNPFQCNDINGGAVVPTGGE